MSGKASKRKRREAVDQCDICRAGHHDPMHAAGRAYEMQSAMEYAADHAMGEFFRALVKVGGPGQYVFDIRPDGGASTPRRLH